MRRVYFITSRTTGMCKIGSSADPTDRLFKIQSNSPVALVLEASFAVADGIGRGALECPERRLHERHLASRSHGEWFRLTPTLEADIAAAKAGDFDVRSLPVATILSWTGNAEAIRAAKQKAAA